MSYTNENVELFSKAHNISIAEAKKEIDLLLEERKNSKEGILKTIRENGYISFPDKLKIYGYGNNDELNSKFICYTPNINKILESEKKHVCIVTGFGATNAPTVGTLSMILKVIDFQKKTGLYTYIIINDLGSVNARKINIEKVLDLTEQFKEFIIKMGFDLTNGEIRTHNDIDHARVFSVVASVVKLSDFASNTEVTDKSYERLNLRGNDFSAMVDHVYTATDCLLPIIKDGKQMVIVPCGLEEFYHANIGAVAIERMYADENLKKLLPDNVEIGAVYSKLIDGLFPYFKQSKSIPQASVYLSDDENVLFDKIVNSCKMDEETVLQMILQTTDWDIDKVKETQLAFDNMEKDMKTWSLVKIEFVKWLLKIKAVWDSCQITQKSLKEKLFIKE